MPFGSFKTVDYTYVPKHNLQVIGQTYDYLQNRHDVAVAQESELKKQIGQLELNAQEDEFKQLLVNNVQSKINDAMIDDFKGYALDDIVAEAGNLMSDPRVLGRLRAQQQYKAYQDNLNARTDLSEDYKNYYRQANTYHYEDKLDAAGNVIGGTEWKPAEQEVSEIPTSIIYNQALKMVQEDLPDQSYNMFFLLPLLSHPFHNIHSMTVCSVYQISVFCFHKPHPECDISQSASCHQFFCFFIQDCFLIFSVI